MFSSFFGSRTPTTSTPAVDITQLSSMVVPHRYRVHLRPNFVEERFDGQVMVEVHVQESVSTIVMHAVGLKFHEIWYKTEGGQGLFLFVFLFSIFTFHFVYSLQARKVRDGC